MKMVSKTEWAYEAFAVVWGPKLHIAKAIAVVSGAESILEPFAMDVHEAQSNGKPRWLRHVTSYKRFMTGRPTKGLSAFALFEDEATATKYAERLNGAVRRCSELMFGTELPAVVCPKLFNPYRENSIKPTDDEKSYKYYTRGLWDRDPMPLGEIINEWNYMDNDYDPDPVGFE